MPIRIPDNLPAMDILKNENLFVMPLTRAQTQDIRPLRIGIVNLMPTKISTETQLLRVLSNTPLQINVTFIQMDTHSPANTSSEHMDTFYKTFQEAKNEKFDGMIITGAPIEHLAYNDVDYWKELTGIISWSSKHVFSTLYICWGAQAGLYHLYGIEKRPLKEKCFGIFEHEKCVENSKLLRGFDDVFYAPHSRHTEIRSEDVAKTEDLIILSESKEAGLYLAASKDYRHVFVTGHSEYDRDTLKLEYERDLSKGLSPSIPKHYFENDDPASQPQIKWRAHSNLLFANWLNYCVYQETPYDINKIC